MPRFDLYQVAVGWSITPFSLQQGPVWGEPFPVAAALDDDLVAGIGQAVQGTIAEDGVIEEFQAILPRHGCW